MCVCVEGWTGCGETDGGSVNPGSNNRLSIFKSFIFYNFVIFMSLSVVTILAFAANDIIKTDFLSFSVLLSC